MQTGLPVVAGWDYHLVQRGQDPAAVGERKVDLARLYRAEDIHEAAEVLRRFHVDWVFCGTEEESAYGPGVAARLARLSPLLEPAFRSGEVVVFRVGRE
jgi:uncharacterized membrane protein